MGDRDLTPGPEGDVEIRDLTPVWGALADPTRRAILDLLQDGPKTLGQLADQFPVSRFAIRKHLNILESADLVLVRWQGLERWNFLNVVPLQTVYERWVTPCQRLWSYRLTALKDDPEGAVMTGSSSVPLTLERVELESPSPATPAGSGGRSWIGRPIVAV
jgi:DNA-binding transcriptional ArsR family regulator